MMRLKGEIWSVTGRASQGCESLKTAVTLPGLKMISMLGEVSSRDVK